MLEKFSDALRKQSGRRSSADDLKPETIWFEESAARKKAGPWWTRPGALVSLSVAALLVVAGLGGAAWWWLGSDGAADPGNYVEVFLTDLPANMTALELTVSGVYVGEDTHALHVDAPVFDILQLRGPSQSLRVASGFVPDANHSTVRIVFSSAIATINGQQVALEIPEAQLNMEHGRSGIDTTSSAVLLDIDVESSIVSTSDGFEFRPFIASVYLHEYSQKPSKGADGSAESSFHKSNKPAFEADPDAKTPREQSTSQPTIKTNPGGGGGSGGGGGGGGGSDPNENGTDPDGDLTDDLLPSNGNATSDDQQIVNETLDLLNQEVGIIIQYTKGQSTVIANHLQSLGLSLLNIFPGDEAAYMRAKLSQVKDVASHGDVKYIELEKEVKMELDTSKQALRAHDIGDLLTGMKDAAGNPIDGRGIGVAVIDTGIDGLHADLPYNTGLHPDPVVIANYKIESISYQLNLVPLPNTDTTSGHGTHVAGIVAGQGSYDAAHRGVAPGAKLYGIGIGEASTTLWTNQGLAWVLANHDQVDPPIRVVTNSWSTGTSYDPRAYSSSLVRQLVDEGVVVIFAAGNSGGDGSSVRTSAEGQNPKEGVIMVGAYEDQDTGTRDGKIRTSSSRGSTGTPSSWPDVMAPGGGILSTKATVSLSGLGLFAHYTEMSGTSMAAPHVAGVVALMLQADPGLSPADVEYILEQTTYKFGDGGGYSSTYSDYRYYLSHHAKGHGLVDARAAVGAVLE